MKQLKTILMAVILTAMAILFLQNMASVEIRFLTFVVTMPQILLLFVTATAGFALGVLVGMLKKSGA